jgi:hypothetical protein
MDSSVSPKDEIWFLRVCHHISTGLYLRSLMCFPVAYVVVECFSSLYEYNYVIRIVCKSMRFIMYGLRGNDNYILNTALHCLVCVDAGRLLKGKGGMVGR